MSLALVTSGTQTATVGTEHTLATVTSGKTLVVKVDVVNMASGDTIEIRAKDKVLTGSTARQAYVESLTGAQTDLVFISVPLPALFSTAFTLKQTAGTGRSFDWSIVSLD